MSISSAAIKNLLDLINSVCLELQSIYYYLDVKLAFMYSVKVMLAAG